MKKLTFLITALCIGFLSCSQNVTDDLNTIMSSYAKLYKFNGSVLVAKHGKILLDKGYGFRNAADKVLNDENTVYQLGSITKQFTTAIILKLQEERKLSVKDKLSKYFPEYPKSDSITLEQLMLHISGIYNYTNNRNFMANEVSKPANREKMMAMFKDKPLDFSPGTKWSYSNSGYSLLGYIIEIVTKKPYEQVVREYIFTPLKMTHSGFDFTHLKSNEKATGYFKLDNTNASIAPIVDSSVSFSAGAIYSTTGDLYLWHKGLEANIILTKTQQEKAYTPVKNNYGYGWVIDSVEGKRRVGHGGGIHGFVTNIARVPEEDICIVMLSNGSDETLQQITNALFNALYNKPYELLKERIEIKLPVETLNQYVGEYEIRPDLHVIMSVQNGELIALPTGQRENILHAEKEDFFFVKEQDIQVEFTRNEQKQLTGFILHQNDRKTSCKKIK